MIKARSVEVTLQGKNRKTLQAWQTDFEDWNEFAKARGWHWRLDDLSLEEKQSRVIEWLSLEYYRGTKKASTAKRKVQAIRWKHVSYPHLHAHPFWNAEGLKDYIRNWGKIDGPKKPKLPVPLVILEAIYCFLDLESLEGASICAATLAGFWFCMRQCEYLGPGLTPSQVILRDTHGHVLTWEALRADSSLLELIHEVTLVIICDKRTSKTSTRSLKKTDKSDVCVVTAFRNLLKAHIKNKGRLPQDRECIFRNRRDNPLRANVINIWIKAAISDAGLPTDRFATHSLRRGGASQWVAAGLSGRDLKKHGRWLSDVYEEYVFETANRVNSILAKATKARPRYEKN